MMDITLDNYEEYFLLLADHELSAAEESSVRKFAAQHPQLQEELQLLLSCRLDATDLPAFPKEILLRPTIWNVDNPAPVHTQMLCLLDDELSVAEKAKLEQQIATNPALQAEWNTLQKTVLPAEAIAYPDKPGLYRQHKIRPLAWMRWAAAAAVVAFTLLLWPAQTDRGLSSGTVAIVPATNQKMPAAARPDNAVVQPTNPTQQITNNASTDAVVATGQHSIDVVREQNKIQKTVALVNPDITAKKEAERTLFKRDVPVPDPKELVANEPQTVTFNNSNSLAATLSKEDNTAVQTAQIAPGTALLSPDALQSTVAVTTNEPDEYDGYVQIAGAKFDKHKVRGLFRGITRSVARTFSKSKIQPAASAYTTGNL